MSIMPQIARFILKEHKQRPIEGDVLLIGRQTVTMNEKEAHALILSEGIELRSHDLEIDTRTIGHGQGSYITDRCFFSMFSSARVRALDVSDYEGADWIVDLNKSPSDWLPEADFIFNGSCLDNLFDPAQAMRNLSAMLRPEGRILSFEHGTPIQSAYLCYSPEWFYSFYDVNDYADCLCWIADFVQMDPNTGEWSMQGDWEIHDWLGGTGGEIIICLAEKGRLSSNDRIPKQEHYRAMHGDQPGRKYQSPRKFEFPNGLSKALLPWR